MSNDSDKTVFKPMPGGTGRANPHVGSDSTAMRPTPGGRGARSTPSGARDSTAPFQGAQAGVVSRGGPSASNRGDSSFFRNISGLNPLVNAASSLIAVIEKTRQSMSHPDIGGLHQRLTSEIRSFDAQVRALGVKPEIALAARYIVCSALDETVLNTPWGSESAWAQRTLLSVFHNETSGGEKFFLILDRMRQSPAENINMIELIYICLSLGFEGKYRLMTRGRDALEQVRDELFTIIRGYRGEYERTLSSSWQGLGGVSKTLTHYVPLWVIVVAVLCVLFFGFGGFRWWLYESTTPTSERLENVVIEADKKILENTDEQFLTE